MKTIAINSISLLRALRLKEWIIAPPYGGSAVKGGTDERKQVRSVPSTLSVLFINALSGAGYKCLVIDA